MATAIGIYVHLTLFQYFELVLGFFLFAGIFFLGFVAIAAHLRYYFHFEKGRKVELLWDRMVITLHDQVVEQIFIKDIIKITLYDQRRDGGNCVSNTFGLFLLFGCNWQKSGKNCSYLSVGYPVEKEDRCLVRPGARTYLSIFPFSE